MMILTDALRPIFEESSKIAFSIFGLSVTWYAIFILTGAIVGSCIGYFCFAKKLGFNSDLLYEGLAFGIIFGVLGARLWYVVFDDFTYDGFWSLINPRNGGLAIHGVILAVAIYLPIFCKKRKIKLLYLLEIAMPLILLAQVFGRWGNFINQEAFGSLVDVFGGLENVSHGAVLTDAQLVAQREVLSNMLIPKFIIDRMYISSSSASGFITAGYYHPTFLYESMLNLIGIIAYMVTRKYVKKIYVGDGLAFYLLWYGVVRIFIESMRSDPLMLGNIRVAQLTSVIYIILAIVFLVLRRVYKYQLISCKEVLHGEGHTMIIDVPVEEENLEHEEKLESEEEIEEKKE